MSNTAGESRFFVDLSHHNSDECLTYACDQCERGGREGQFLPLRQTPTGDTLVICDTCEQQGFPTADDIAATMLAIYGTSLRWSHVSAATHPSRW